MFVDIIFFGQINCSLAFNFLDST